jgi:hypothetical protein
MRDQDGDQRLKLYRSVQLIHHILLAPGWGFAQLADQHGFGLRMGVWEQGRHVKDYNAGYRQEQAKSLPSVLKNVFSGSFVEPGRGTW